MNRLILLVLDDLDLSFVDFAVNCYPEFQPEGSFLDVTRFRSILAVEDCEMHAQKRVPVATTDLPHLAPQARAPI